MANTLPMHLQKVMVSRNPTKFLYLWNVKEIPKNE